MKGDYCETMDEYNLACETCPPGTAIQVSKSLMKEIIKPKEFTEDDVSKKFYFI